MTACLWYPFVTDRNGTQFGLHIITRLEMCYDDMFILLFRLPAYVYIRVTAATPQRFSLEEIVVKLFVLCFIPFFLLLSGFQGAFLTIYDGLCPSAGYFFQPPDRLDLVFARAVRIVFHCDLRRAVSQQLAQRLNADPLF